MMISFTYDLKVFVNLESKQEDIGKINDKNCC